MTKYSGQTTVSVKEKNLIMIFFTTPQTMNKLKLCKITKCDKNQIVATQIVMKLKLQKKTLIELKPKPSGCLKKEATFRNPGIFLCAKEEKALCAKRSDYTVPKTFVFGQRISQL